METKITCPHCLSKNCFVEEQKEFSSYMCFNCGFMSDSRFVEKSLEIADYMKTMPESVKSLQFVDETREIVWFPSILNMGAKGMIYPETSKHEPSNYKWKFAQVIEVPNGKEGEYEGHQQFLDVENAKTYDKFEFMDACKDMGIIKE